MSSKGLSQLGGGGTACPLHALATAVAPLALAAPKDDDVLPVCRAWSQIRCHINVIPLLWN